uniref:UDP-glycosyltransferases domain-containing protein n=1 Tax=Kalanchoe fedtschenkoi TaxID=63787 RepID=A0A7N0VIP8_KALFE
MPVPGEDLSAEFCFDNIPKCPKYPWWQISPMYRTYRHSAGSDPDPDSESVKDGFKANLESWGHVINTFDDVEGVYLDNLRKELGHDRVWAVGPLVLTRAGSVSPGLDADVARFLDTCDDDSVVYVAFGSQITLRNDQLAALAAGLEKSGVRFIWVAADGHVDGGYGSVPDGFETRVAGRGVVVRGWAPQAAILSHRAAGAFLTHCGWNSVVESIVAGVPMLTWPMGADQFSDATLVVNELMVGVRVCEGKASVPDSDELSRFLRDSVGRDSSFGSVLRERARKLKEKALEAVKDGGSSARGLNEMVRYLFDI